MGMPAVRSLPLVYLVYVPRKEEIDVLNSPDFNAITQAANPDMMRSILCSLNYEILDTAAHKYPVDMIVSHVHERSLRSFDRIWIGGGGSSAFARAVIVAAYDLGIPVSDHTPSGSPLGRYLALFRRSEARASYVVGAKLGFFG